MSTSAASSRLDPKHTPAPGPDDGLVFVVKDLHSPRQPPAPPPPPPAGLKAAPVDGFVIREAHGSGPVIPLDAMVVGAPAVAPAAPAAPPPVVRPAAPATPAPAAGPGPKAGFSVISAAPAGDPAPAATTPSPGFRVHSMATTGSALAAPVTAELPWTVRERGAPTTPVRGWSPRRSELIERSTADTVRRLREEAVMISWKAAWIAVTAADRRLYRARGW